MHPQTLLMVLIGVIPLAVLVAGGAAFLLLRAGFGFLVWGVLPFVGLLVVAAAMGLVFGRAASSWRSSEGERSGRGRTRKRD